MLGPSSLPTSTLDQFRRLLNRAPVEPRAKDSKDDDEPRAREADRRNRATEARNYLDDQGNPQSQAVNTVTKAAADGQEERKAQLKEKLRMLIEQLKSLMQFAMRTPAMARAVAQLSREIASVAKQLGSAASGVSLPTAAPTAAPVTAVATASPAGPAAATAGPAAATGTAEGTQAATATQGETRPQDQASGQESQSEAESETGGDEIAGDETPLPTTAEAAAAQDQAVMEKIKGAGPGDKSDPELKELLTQAKALLRKAKAMLEEMAGEARRAGKSDTFEEERKEAAEAITEIERIDTGDGGELTAGAIVSLIA